eukprot:1161469-Pelagomonas_calceolata.AAC.47
MKAPQVDLFISDGRSYTIDGGFNITHNPKQKIVKEYKTGCTVHAPCISLTFCSEGLSSMLEVKHAM